jgi:hypothetical protein
MQRLTRHHHFKSESIPADDRVARLEMTVVKTLLDTDVPDEARDSSIAWELKHQAGVTQFARMLSNKRSLDVDLAAAGALLHDIYTIVTGSYMDHARRGGPIADRLLRDIGGFSRGERGIINQIVINHSDKHIIDSDAYIEFGKDVDVLDCLTYPNSLDEYFLTKPLPKVYSYLARAKLIWAELGLSPSPAFTSLDRLTSQGLLLQTAKVLYDEAVSLLNTASVTPATDPFALQREPAAEDYRLFTISEGKLYATAISMSAVSPRNKRQVQQQLTQLHGADILMVWPGLHRYEIMSEDDAHAKGRIIRASGEGSR